MSDLAVSLRSKASKCFEERRFLLDEDRLKLVYMFRRSGSWVPVGALVEQLAGEVSDELQRQILQFQSGLIKARNVGCARLPQSDDDTARRDEDMPGWMRTALGTLTGEEFVAYRT